MSDSSEYESTLHIGTEEWLQILEREYLGELIPSGGSAVKFISGTDPVLQEAARRIQEMAVQQGFYYAFLDPLIPDKRGKRPDLHRIDRFFFAVTRETDWKGWAQAQARRFLNDRGIQVHENRPLNDIEGIAQDNRRLTSDLMQEYQKEFATPLLRDDCMAVEFRAAVTALGRAQLIPDHMTPTMEEVLLAWFEGRTMLGAARTRKKLMIFENIGLNNARNIFASFCHWLPQTGHRGLVVVLDFRPYEYKKVAQLQQLKENWHIVKEAVNRGASQQELQNIILAGEAQPAYTYSNPAYMQMLSLLRHFIDEIDRFERLLLVVLTSPAFYDISSRRSYFNYDALQTRIGLEVRDAHRANPAAALVHLRETRYE
jgi:hypothetical protein